LLANFENGVLCILIGPINFLSTTPVIGNFRCPRRRFSIKSLFGEKFIFSKKFLLSEKSKGFTSFISSKTASVNSYRGFYQKLIQSLVILCQMIAEYYIWCLAHLGSVSYILVGTTVVVRKHGAKSFNTGVI